MERYRLRFLLQEFDLRPDVTIIGRSSECHVTIDDPLVSRRHARLTIDSNGVRFEDLGSRNGSKLNGEPVEGKAYLSDGDRLRIGTQELLFCSVRSGYAATRSTGFLRHCSSCQMPYPKEVSACPSCGFIETDVTKVEEPSEPSVDRWSGDLVHQAVERALDRSRIQDARRLMKLATEMVDQRIEAGAPLSPETEKVAQLAARVGFLAGDPFYSCWSARTYALLQRCPPVRIVEQFGEAVRGHSSEVAPALSRLLDVCRTTLVPPSEEEQAAILRLEEIVRVAPVPRFTEGSP